MWKNLLYIIFLLLSACISDGAQKVIVENQKSIYFGKDGKYKLVRLSRTTNLATLAGNYKVPINLLKKLNEESSSFSVLKPGKIIKIPIGNFYKIKENDTLESIARIQDVDINEFAKSNFISINQKLYSNEYLIIPEAKIKFQEQNNYEDYKFDEVKEEIIPQQTNIKPSNQNTGARYNSEAFVLKEKLSFEEQKNKKKFFKNKTPLGSKNFIWPLHGKVLKNYGYHQGKFHDGISISAKKGTPIIASSEGNVIYVGEQKQYGNLLIIQHKDNYKTAYAHTERTLVKKGDFVKQGQQIALVGTSGGIKTAQLLFSMQKGNKMLNPDG